MGVSPIGSLPFRDKYFPLNHDYGRESINPEPEYKIILSRIPLLFTTFLLVTSAVWSL